MTLNEFINLVSIRPLPQNPMARVRTLAKELAEGVALGVWDEEISLDHGQIRKRVVKHYLEQRWEDNYPSVKMLAINEYVKDHGHFLTIDKNSFDLLEETEPSTIFISYQRAASSAFALLVLKYLNEAELEPFLDISLEPGEDWHAGLKERIQSRDYFILLLGKTTLESPYVIKEIEWALEKDLAIIPIWQPEFEFNAAEWVDLPDPIKDKLTNTHSIKVQQENPLEYDKAMTELLNCFGITP